MDFIPNFIFSTKEGEISNRNSIINVYKEFIFVSVNDSINIYDSNTIDKILSIKNNFKLITSFDVSNNYLAIGYENGLIEIIYEFMTTKEITKLKVCRKRITSIKIKDNILYSVSNDGTLFSYDLQTTVILKYSGNGNALLTVDIDNDTIVCASSDNSIKIWKKQNSQIEYSVLFETQILSSFIRGNEIIVALRDGKIFIYNLENKTKVLISQYKKIRNVVVTPQRLIVQTKNKTAFYKISEFSFSPNYEKSEATSSEIIKIGFLDENESLICLSSFNNIFIFGKKPMVMSHRTQIKGIEITDDQKIVSMSENSVILWKLFRENRYRGMSTGDIQYEANNMAEFDISVFDKDELVALNEIIIDGALSMCLLSNKLVVANKKGLSVINLDLFTVDKFIEMSLISNVSSFGNVIAVCIENSVVFLNSEFDNVGGITVNDSIVFSRFSPNGQIFSVSCLDNKIYVYGYPDLHLKYSLYGHSLPCRYFCYTKSDLLLSCGADRLIKIWGLSYGECKKTIIGNAKSVEPVKDSLFLYGDGMVIYSDNGNRLKRYECFDAGYIKVCDDFVVCSDGCGILVYRYDKYELVEESSEEDETPVNVSDVKDYERFLDYLEDLENESSDNRIDLFYRFMSKISWNELMSYLEVLTQKSVHVILRSIRRNVDSNVILNGKIISQLSKSSMEICTSDELFFEVKEIIKSRISELRENIGISEGKMKMQINYESL